jgi:hypothetical protein
MPESVPNDFLLSLVHLKTGAFMTKHAARLAQVNFLTRMPYFLDRENGCLLVIASPTPRILRRCCRARRESLTELVSRS